MVAYYVSVLTQIGTCEYVLILKMGDAMVLDEVSVDGDEGWEPSVSTSHYHLLLICLKV